MDKNKVAVRFKPDIFPTALRRLADKEIPHRVIGPRTVVIPASGFDTVADLSPEKQQVVHASGISLDRLAKLRAQRPLP